MNSQANSINQYQIHTKTSKSLQHLRRQQTIRENLRRFTFTVGTESCRLMKLRSDCSECRGRIIQSLKPIRVRKRHQGFHSSILVILLVSLSIISLGRLDQIRAATTISIKIGKCDSQHVTHRWQLTSRKSLKNLLSHFVKVWSSLVAQIVSFSSILV